MERKVTWEAMKYKLQSWQCKHQL